MPLSTLAGFLLAVRAARNHASAPKRAEYFARVGRHHICSLLPQSSSKKTVAYVRMRTKMHKAQTHVCSATPTPTPLTTGWSTYLEKK